MSSKLRWRSSTWSFKGGSEAEVALDILQWVLSAQSFLSYTLFFSFEVPLLGPELLLICPWRTPQLPGHPSLPLDKDINFCPKSLLSKPGFSSIFCRALLFVRLYLLLFFCYLAFLHAHWQFLLHPWFLFTCLPALHAVQAPWLPPHFV